MGELDDPLRLDKLEGAFLDASPDETLNACAREAAERAGTPIALVSLVMRRIQLFRASYGLPQDLSVSRATSRCDSFCQFVVRTEGPFIVAEASTDLRVPQDLVRRYGIMAYAGVPLRYEGHVLGSLCVIDTQPRTFDAQLIEDLTVIGGKVVQRLSSLKELPPSTPLPVLSEDEARAALKSVARDGLIVERALREIDAVLRAAASIDAAAAASELAEEYAGFHRDIALLYDELFEQIRGIADAAVAASATLQRGALAAHPAAGDALTALQRSARGLTRSMAEVTPLVRLIQAFADRGALSLDVFARNASVLREALDFDQDVLAALRVMREAAARIEEALRDRRDDPPAGGGAPGGEAGS